MIRGENINWFFLSELQPSKLVYKRSYFIYAIQSPMCGIMSCLGTLQVPGDMGPLWYHNQVFSDWSDCISTPAKAPPPAHPNILVPVRGKISVLKMDHLLQFPSSPFQGLTELTFHSILKYFPVLNICCELNSCFFSSKPWTWEYKLVSSGRTSTT
jgi:hypothetical protein